MKITDQLVLLVNARLQDLKFEIDTVGYLQNIEEDTELSRDFAEVDPSTPLREVYPLEYDPDGNEIEIPYEVRTMFAIKNILRDMGQFDSQGIIQMVANRSGKELNSLEDLVKLYEDTEYNIKNVLQTDMVKNFLVEKGLESYSVKDIDEVKDNVLESVMETLGINSEELK
jgi:hypothetical protein